MARRSLVVVLALSLGLSSFALGAKKGNTSVAQAGSMGPALAQAGNGAGGVSTLTPGAVIESDNFSNPTTGLFQSSSDGQFTWGYADGDYRIASPTYVVSTGVFPLAPGDFTDVSVSVDGHRGPNAAPSSSDQFFGVGCRVTGETGYFLKFSTLNHNWRFIIMYPGVVDEYIKGNINVPPMLGEVGHVTLICQGTTITGIVNGVQVFSTQLTNFQHGQVALYGGAGGLDTNGNGILNGRGYPSIVDEHFNNFVVRQP